MSDKIFTPTNPNAPQSVKNVLKYLSDISGDKILTGQHTQTIPMEEIEYIKDGKIFKGKALDINPDFTLEIETGAGTESLSSGEISLIMR